MALTDTACRAAKGRETEYKRPDGGGVSAALRSHVEHEPVGASSIDRLRLRKISAMTVVASS